MAGVFDKWHGGGVICDHCGAFIERYLSGNVIFNLQVRRPIRDHDKGKFEILVPKRLKSYNLCSDCMSECLKVYKKWMVHKWDKSDPVLTDDGK